ncbi:hypothetical protein AVEN_207739-1 [Araneus ventricosus]|uniref:Uncharacterized protein n=1 Tax=Araneus ventricosus TaxID=182803 RepID=A0A4Y2J7M8_ARAVE|nr:hypothetical protein AVEN_207739-1 [Araneus ventricosus]
MRVKVLSFLSWKSYFFLQVDPNIWIHWFSLYNKLPASIMHKYDLHAMLPCVPDIWRQNWNRTINLHLSCLLTAIPPTANLDWINKELELALNWKYCVTWENCVAYLYKRHGMGP